MLATSCVVAHRDTQTIRLVNLYTFLLCPVPKILINKKNHLTECSNDYAAWCDIQQ